MRGNIRGKVDEVDHRVLVTNWVKRRGLTANGKRLMEVPFFGNIAVCLACGKEEYVNTCGFCEKCWVTFSHLRKRTDP